MTRRSLIKSILPRLTEIIVLVEGIDISLSDSEVQSKSHSSEEEKETNSTLLSGKINYINYVVIQKLFYKNIFIL